MNDQNYVTILKESYKSRKEKRKDIIEEIIGKIHHSRTQLRISLDELYLVIDEAITNAMEHGNKWDSNKEIGIEVLKNNRYLKILIKDQGNGFDQDMLTDNKSSVKNLKPRGRGIYIIKQFCEPSWNETGNQIQLRFDTID